VSLWKRGNVLALPTTVTRVNDLDDAVPMADLVTMPRKRASGKGVGTFDGTHSRSLEETQGKTGPDRKLATITEFR
jgi:hypothetical protein